MRAASSSSNAIEPSTRGMGISSAAGINRHPAGCIAFPVSCLVPRHTDLARTQALLSMAYDYSSVLAYWEPPENRLDTGEHRLGICPEEEQASLLRACQKPRQLLSPAAPPMAA